MIAVAPIAEKQATMNADEFWAFVTRPENQDRHLELVEGVIIEMAGGTGGSHGEVDVLLAYHMASFVVPRKAGRLTGAETGYRLFANPNGKDIVRCPDVGFVSIERAPQPLPLQ